MELTLIGKLVVAMMVPATIALFITLPPRRAATIAMIMGFLFLPEMNIRIIGIPDMTKKFVLAATIFSCMLLFDFRSMLKIKFHSIDLAMLIWCSWAFVSSVTNGFGPYDGLSESLNYVITWGIPYLIGRVYLQKPEHIREFAILMIVGGLIYLPLCWYEMRMSPQLHRMIYGYAPTEFVHLTRGEGYKPMVFFNGGLPLAMWLTIVSVMAVWLWRNKVVTTIKGIPLVYLLPPLVITALLTRSVFAVMMLFFGLGVLYASTLLKSRVFLLIAGLLPFIYITARATGMWDGQSAIDLAGEFFRQGRVLSLQTRIDTESVIVNHVIENEKILFGFGGWNAWRPTDWEGNENILSDGMWVITFGRGGLLGVGSLLAMMLLPALVWSKKYPPTMWKHPTFAPGAVMAVMIILHMLDCLLNAMANPVYYMAAGGLVSMIVSPVRINRPVKRIRTNKNEPESGREEHPPPTRSVANA